MTYTHPSPVIRTLIYASISLLLAAAAFAQTGNERGIKVRSAQEAGIGTYDPARFHALVIGINNYNQWPKLRTAVNDAGAVADALVRYYGFPAGQVRRLLDEKATRRNILAELDRLADLGPDDSVLIYYAGHGWMDARNNGFWIPVDAPEDDKVAYVSNAQIVQEYFKKYQVRHLLVVSDSCFSGTLLRGKNASRETGWRIPTGFQKPSRWVMTSGDLAPVPDDAGTGHSPFATRLLQYLCYGDEPAFGIYDLFGFVKRTLEGGAICEPLDTPAHMPGGEFVLARLDKPVDLPGSVSAQSSTPDVGTMPKSGLGGGRPREPSRTGGLFVETVPAGALVKAGGHDIQRSPFTFRNLPAGPLAVTVELADHDTETRQVTIPVDDFATLTIALKRQQGRISVASDPSMAEIWIGGQKVGETPHTLTSDVGTVALTLKRDGYEDKTISVQVRGGQTASTGAVVFDKLRDPTAANMLGMQFVEVKAGSFQMGSDDGGSDEKPVRTVQITRDFWMGKTEVTQKQYQQLMGSNPSSFKGDDLPVESVSWDDAVEYCEALTKLEQSANRLPQGYVYRLPTEAEWEYACRAGTTGPYAGNLDEMGWRRLNSGSKTQPVGGKKPNAWGLYDMHGNVWEWCRDWYGDYPSGSVTDPPQGASSGSDRVFRGGSWFGTDSFCRSAYRNWFGPTCRSNALGFRVVLAPVP
jgi:formylglycine-generating enzyme required for sulfatase activity